MIRLPLQPPPAADASPQRNNSGTKAAGRRNRGKRVLIIDDDADGAESMRLLLRHSGHEAEVAHDGEKALQLAAGFRPDAILVDIGLPKMDGYEVVKELRKRDETRGSLMIAVTGYGAESDVRKSQEAGFDYHMTKPVNLNALLGRLDNRD